MEHKSVGARLSVMMFLEFFVWGAWYVTVGNFIGSIGWDAGVIGWAYTVGPIAGVISPFFLGMVADRFFATERVLGAMHIIGGIIMFLVPMTARGESPPSTPFVWLLFAHMVCYMPTLGLVNTLSFHNMTNQEKQFPMIRVFGTIGWIAANIVVSKLLHADRSALQFQITGASGLLLGVYSFTLPHTPPPAAGKAFSLSDALGLDALVLLKNPSFLVFIVSSFLICIPLAAYYSFAPVYADAVGFEDAAFTMSFGQMSEVFFMVVMPIFFARLGVKWMLAVGMLAWVVRYGLFAAGAPEAIHWMVLTGIFLHGICYDFFFVTGQIYVDKKAPVAIRGQAQGFLVLMTLGLGLLIGAQISGQIVGACTPAAAAELQRQAGAKGGEIFQLEKQLANAPEVGATGIQEKIDKLTGEKNQLSREANKLVDWKSVWTYPAIAAGVILLLFALIFRDDTKRAPPPTV